MRKVRCTHGMDDEHTKYCCAPDSMDEEDVDAFMECNQGKRQ